jgi:hypothetical protein
LCQTSPSLIAGDSRRTGGAVTGQLSQKHAGAYFTPDVVVSTLLKWGGRDESDRLIDPACGDGRFIAGHRNAVGIERDSPVFDPVLAATFAVGGLDYQPRIMIPGADEEEG